MKFQTLGFGFVLIGSLAASRASAQVLHFVSGDYEAYARAEIGDQSKEESKKGKLFDDSASFSSIASLESNDLVLGYTSAYAAGGANWKTETVGNLVRLSGGAGGLAETRSDGIDNYAVAYGMLTVIFDLTEAAKLDLYFDGTNGTDLDRWDGSNWTTVVSYLQGPDSLLADAGRYRWHGGAGDSSNGTNAYSQAVGFNIEATPVPEPLTFVAMGAGLLALRRRRFRA